MAQAATITINDGQATPVATNFSPESITPQISSFADRLTGTALAYRRLRLGNSFANSKSKVNRAKLSIECPVTATVDGVPTLVSTLRFNGEFIYPDGATDSQRKDLFAFVKNALAHATVTAACRDLDPVY